MVFGKLFGRGREKREEDLLSPLPSAVTQSILNSLGAHSIPPMPSSAQKSFQLAIDPDAEAHDFIEVLESDEALAARVLKIANSVYFDRGKPSTTIEESVLVIGINELRCLLNATSLRELFPSRHSARPICWANDVATALIARSLAQRLQPSKSELAFLAGLMHDVGKLLFIQRQPEEYQKVLQRVEQEGIPFHEAEALRFPFDHTEVGQLIAERWNFGPELATVIRHHHQPWEKLPGTATTSLIHLVKAADIFAHALGLGHTSRMRQLQFRHKGEAEVAWDMLGVPASDRTSRMEEFARVYETEFDLYAGPRAP